MAFDNDKTQIRHRVLILIALGWSSYACGSGMLEVSPTTNPDSPTTQQTISETDPVISISDDSEVIRQRYRDGLPLFEYDADTPLDVEEEAAVTADGGYESQVLSFPSPRGYRVQAMLVAPSSDVDSLRPALLIVDADSHTDEFDLAADYAANLGFVVLMIEPPAARKTDVPRPGLGVYTFTAGDRDEQIDFIVDLRRAIDLLGTRDDVDMETIGVRAWGIGAETAALLSGVEDRINAYNLINLVGGPVTFYTRVDPDNAAFSALSPEERRAWLEAMEPIEPIYYVGQAAPAVLLFQLEGAFFQQNAKQLVELASEPKEVDEVQEGQGFAADCRAASWLANLFDLSNTVLNSNCP